MLKYYVDAAAWVGTPFRGRQAGAHKFDGAGCNRHGSTHRRSSPATSSYDSESGQEEI